VSLSAAGMRMVREEINNSSTRHRHRTAEFSPRYLQRRLARQQFSGRARNVFPRWWEPGLISEAPGRRRRRRRSSHNHVASLARARPRPPTPGRTGIHARTGGRCADDDDVADAVALRKDYYSTRAAGVRTSPARRPTMSSDQ